MLWKRTVRLVAVLYLILGTWKGYVALYEPGETEPRQIFPQMVSALPEADQDALGKGIIVRSDAKLQQLLEDYLS